MVDWLCMCKKSGEPMDHILLHCEWLVPNGIPSSALYGWLKLYSRPFHLQERAFGRLQNAIM